MSDHPKPLVLVIDPDPVSAPGCEGVSCRILRCDRQIAFGRPKSAFRSGPRQQGDGELRWNDSDREDQGDVPRHEGHPAH